MEKSLKGSLNNIKLKNNICFKSALLWSVIAEIKLSSSKAYKSCKINNRGEEGRIKFEHMLFVIFVYEDLRNQGV